MVPADEKLGRVAIAPTIDACAEVANNCAKEDDTAAQIGATSYSNGAIFVVFSLNFKIFVEFL